MKDLRVVLSYRWSFYQYKGGLEKYVFYLSRELASSGLDVHVISSGTNYSKMRVSKNLKLITIPPLACRPVTLTTYLFSLNLAWYLKGMDFDIFHSFETASLGYLLLNGGDQRPTLVHAPGFEPVTVRYLFNPLEIFLNIPLEYSLRYCMEHADYVLTLGPSFSKYACERFNISPNKLFELPNGIPVTYIRQIVNKPAFTRGEIGLKPDDFVLICVGRLIPLKGLPYLLEALNIIMKECGTAVKLLLVGAGPLESRLQEQIKRLGLSGQVLHLKNLSEEELYSLYAISDIAVLPILDISGPDLSVLEAMATGLPVITTSVWENPSAIKHGGNGFLVPPRNANALSEAIIEAYARRDGLRKMGRASQHLVEQYDWGNVAKKAIELYLRVVNGT